VVAWLLPVSAQRLLACRHGMVRMSATPDADQCSVLGIILGVVAFFAAPLVWGTLGILLGLAAYRGRPRQKLAVAAIIIGVLGAVVGTVLHPPVRLRLTSRRARPCRNASGVRPRHDADRVMGTRTLRPPLLTRRRQATPATRNKTHRTTRGASRPRSPWPCPASRGHGLKEACSATFAVTGPSRSLGNPPWPGCRRPAWLHLRMLPAGPGGAPWCLSERLVAPYPDVSHDLRAWEGGPRVGRCGHVARISM
jgi:hypothetical protein